MRLVLLVGAVVAMVGCVAQPVIPPAGDRGDTGGFTPNLDGHVDPVDAGDDGPAPDLAPKPNPNPNPNPGPKPPDMAQPQPQLNGCNGAIGCVNNCTTQACQNGCMQMTTPSGQTKFNALLTCVDNACPGVYSFDPCYTATSTQCNNCVSSAQSTGGACESKLTACTSDTP